MTLYSIFALVVVLAYVVLTVVSIATKFNACKPCVHKLWRISCLELSEVK